MSLSPRANSTRQPCMTLQFITAALLTAPAWLTHPINTSPGQRRRSPELPLAGRHSVFLIGFWLDLPLGNRSATTIFHPQLSHRPWNWAEVTRASSSREGEVWWSRFCQRWPGGPSWVSLGLRGAKWPFRQDYSFLQETWPSTEEIWTRTVTQPWLKCSQTPGSLDGRTRCQLEFYNESAWASPTTRCRHLIPF